MFYNYVFFYMACFYLLCAFIVTIAAFMRKSVLHDKNTKKHFLSILVPARNEEKDLPQCLEALLKIEYPEHLYEIIVIDDVSTDKTSQVIDFYLQQSKKIQKVSTFDYQGSLKLKARALAMGAKKARGDWLVIVDADAVVSPQWANTIVQNMTENVGIVAAPMVAYTNGLAGKAESLFEAYAMSVIFGLENLGARCVACGPNMAIRKSIYDATGGLEKSNLWVAEDLALTQMALHQNYRVSGNFSKESLVRVAPIVSLRGLLTQHHRWIQGGLVDAPWYLKMIVACVFLYASLGSVFTLFGFLLFQKYWLLSVCLRMLADGLLLYSALKRFKMRKLFVFFPILELYLVSGFFILPFTVLMYRSCVWSGAGYREVLSR